MESGIQLMESGIQLMESGIQNRILKSGIQPLVESGIHGCGIRNPRMWNPESTDVEFGIHRHGIWNPQHVIRNPRLSWITLGRTSQYCILLYTSCSFLKGQLQCPFVRLSKSDSNQQQLFSGIDTRTIRSHQNHNQAKISSA